ncbi:glycoside hydrolase family 13 protein [Domibacillus enclensis]|uniref:Alpha-glucosidase n=1 Tax=Domibacillus enclensis TaxID=1017273 RepID=A0A1N7A725_9BACI|nr:alpha-glucosidase [Domibacillus enclensis]OXS75722.1 alpha-glucosidase [Domibacillus enclensis]SIR34935.1 oligo-1,6-glucosidase/alpha-glucosidase [Domibacillus enclensis]
MIKQAVKQSISSDRKWWEQSVVYQVYPKSFYDSDHDGVGDLQGVIQKLDYLQELGIDVIWLSPVYSSPMDDNGYDISDYQGIAEEFGTMADMDELIAQASKRGIKLIMDLVVNHTSDEHVWFAQSKTDKNHPQRDWYIWQDGIGTGPPNSWQSVFGGSCWEYEPVTGQYYMHTFSKKQPDLNWENPQLRQAVYQMIDWWIAKGIAGFRVDAITFIKKSFDAAGQETGIVKANQCGIDTMLKELSEQSFRKHDLLTVAEAPGVSLDQLSSYVGTDGYFSMLFEFDHIDLDLAEDGRWYKPKKWSLHDFKEAISGSQTLFNEQGWGALYLENHDQPRSLNKFIEPAGIGPMSAKMLAAVYFLLKGTPFIYQGQELGMTNTSFQSVDEFNDLASIDQYEAALKEGFDEKEALRAVGNRSRDNARTPMQWSRAENGGFSTGQPWLPSNSNYQIVNAENRQDPDSVFSFYKQLINLRKNSEYTELLTYGQYEEVLGSHPDVMAYIRRNEDKAVAVLANFKNKEVEIDFPYQVKKVILTNSSETAVEHTLQPYECFVLELTN